MLLGIGMLGVLAHLGRPKRFLNALANPSAMITQEAYWSIPFGCILLIDALLLKLKQSKNLVIPIIGSVLGCGLLVVTSIAYFTSYGVAGWPEVPTLFLFSVGDLAMGAAFAIAFSTNNAKASEDTKENPSTPQAPLIITGVLSLAFSITLIAEAIVFAGLPVGPWGFVISAVLATGAAALQALSAFGKLDIKHQNWICFALIALAAIISRYAFYAMY